MGDYGRDALPLLEKCQVIYTPIREDPFSAEKMREFEEYLAACSPAPAIRNAILNATGVAFDACPITPHVLYRGFKEAGLIED